MVTASFTTIALFIAGTFLGIGVIWLVLLRWYTAHMESFYSGVAMKIGRKKDPHTTLQERMAVKTLFLSSDYL